MDAVTGGDWNFDDQRRQAPFYLGYEDYQRYKSDREMNYETYAEIVRDGQFVKIFWSQVVVGDICLVYSEDMFPADLILLASSAKGSAFIETASLDGEKNLKPRNAFKETLSYDTIQALNQLKGKLEGIIPNKQLHRFKSTMIVDDNIMMIESDKQLLYRGTRLKNTKWIYGLVVYTGRNTKIMLNS